MTKFLAALVVILLVVSGVSAACGFRGHARERHRERHVVVDRGHERGAIFPRLHRVGAGCVGVTTTSAGCSGYTVAPAAVPMPQPKK